MAGARRSVDDRSRFSIAPRIDAARLISVSTDRAATAARPPGSSVFLAGDRESDRLVVVCHPLGGSARFDPDPTATSGAGVSLLAVDRPGYGGSRPASGGSGSAMTGRVEDVVNAVARFRAAAGMTDGASQPFHLVGWGVGALVAAAVASQHPDLVGRVALVNPRPPLPRSRSTYRAGTAGLTMTEVPVGEDRDLQHRPDLAERVQAMIRAGTKQGLTGVTADQGLLEDTTWCDDMARLRGRTRCWVGMRLLGASPATAWWRQRIPDLPIEKVWSSGRFTIAVRWSAILEDLLHAELHP